MKTKTILILGTVTAAAGGAAWWYFTRNKKTPTAPRPLPEPAPVVVQPVPEPFKPQPIVAPPPPTVKTQPPAEVPKILEPLFKIQQSDFMAQSSTVSSSRTHRKPEIVTDETIRGLGDLRILF